MQCLVSIMYKQSSLSQKKNYMMEFDDFWEGIYVTW